MAFIVGPVFCQLNVHTRLVKLECVICDECFAYSYCWCCKTLWFIVSLRTINSRDSPLSLAEKIGKLQYTASTTGVVANGKEICLNASDMMLVAPMGTPLFFVTVVLLRLYIFKCKNIILYVHHVSK